MKALLGFPSPVLQTRLNKRLGPSAVHVMYVTPQQPGDGTVLPAPPPPAPGAPPPFHEGLKQSLHAVLTYPCIIPQQQCPGMRRSGAAWFLLLCLTP